MRLICKENIGWFPNIPMFNADTGEKKYHYSKVYKDDEFVWPGDAGAPPPPWAVPHPEDEDAVEYYAENEGFVAKEEGKWVFAATPAPAAGEASDPTPLGDKSEIPKKRGPGRPRKAVSAK